MHALVLHFMRMLLIILSELHMNVDQVDSFPFHSILIYEFVPNSVLSQIQT